MIYIVILGVQQFRNF